MVEEQILELSYNEIYKTVQDEFKSVFLESKNIQELFDHLNFINIDENWFKIPGQPEAYTSKFVKKLIEKAGVPTQSLLEQTTVKREKTVFHERLRRYPDYMVIKGQGSSKGLLIEIEPIGKNLAVDIEKFQKKTYIRQDGRKDHLSGIAQVLEWYSEFTGLEIDYDGLATNFVNWYLVFHSGVEYQMKWVEISPQDALELIIRVAKGKSPDYTTRNFEVLYDTIEKFYKLFNERLSYIISNIKGEKCKRPDIKILNIPSDKSLEEKILLGVGTYRTNFFRMLFIRILEEWKLIPFDPIGYIFTKIEPAQTLLLHQLFFEVFNQTQEERKSNPDIDTKFLKLPYLNGGLFRRTSAEKDYNVKLGSSVYRDMWKMLTSFSFTKKKSENNNINPEVLGYIFERTLEATGERKKTGTYFTPDIITHYMAKELINSDVVEKLNVFIKKKMILNYSIDSIEEIDTLEKNVRKELFNKLVIILKRIKICDNACGSGAFLKSCGDEIINLYRRIYNFFSWELDYLSKTPKGKRPFKNLYSMKRFILQHNLYGVDYLESASEGCQLRLWLWLVEPPSDYKSVMLVESLPNIDFNIRRGNTLIGFHGFDIDKSIISKNSHFIEMIESYYLEKKDSKKDEEIRKILFHLRSELYGLLNEQYRIKLSDFFKDIKLNDDIQKRLERTRDFSSKEGQLDVLDFLRIFHWNVDFYNILKNGGFDIIIGNPPYVRAEIEDDHHILQREVLKSMNKEYPSLIEKWDVFIAFIELSFRYLLKKGGKFGYIVSNALCTVNYAKKIREYLVTDHRITSIDFIEDFEVFKGIGVVPVILFA
ncbi:MAG: Eco57I restriction-modification methylase domain-containing protein, partial [Candidatus Thorarchaeota archaeon]